MPAPIEFWFDFTSPYAYFASEAIEALAARYGRTVTFKPTLLGVVFKTTGGQPLTQVPVKGDYATMDFARSARFAGVQYQLPSVFPIMTVAASRAFVWINDKYPAQAVPFAHATFRAYFAQNRNIADSTVLAEVAAGLGIDGAALVAAIQQPEIKDRFKALVDESIARGVFGAPFVFVDGEPFWGNDRLPQVEHRLAHGPF